MAYVTPTEFIRGHPQAVVDVLADASEIANSDPLGIMMAALPYEVRLYDMEQVLDLPVLPASAR